MMNRSLCAWRTSCLGRSPHAAEVLGGAINTFQHIVPNNHTQLFMDFGYGAKDLFNNGLGLEIHQAMARVTTCGAAQQDLGKQPLVPVDVALFVTAEVDANEKRAEVRGRA